MKKLLLLTLSLAIGTISIAQQTTNNWDFDGLNREYIQYVPASYNANEAVPLVIVLHGLGDNMANMAQVGFHQVSDTANFIVVTPQAIVDQAFTGSTAWNSGAGAFGISLNGDVDDIGFINALIDTISDNFNIDQSRVFATGFSMGGFMSNRIACELNNRVAAIASVGGTIGGALTCNPGQARRVCHFHGTDDATVGYGMPDGIQDNTFGNNVTDWISFWTSNNSCGSVTVEGQFPNSANDNYIVDYVEYAGCTADSRVVHYKVHGADHVWLGPNNDVFYTTEIWKFFLGLSPTNLVPAGIEQTEVATVGVYPNPTTDVLRIENLDSKMNNISVFNAEGQLVLEFSGLNQTIDVSTLSTGLYQIMIATEKGLYSNSFIKN